MSVSASRVAVVTVALLDIGIVCGAVLGGLAFVVHIHPFLTPPSTLPAGTRLRLEVGVWFFFFRFGATAGAYIGAALAPMIGWLFLRRVPLARAIGQTALGALLGIAVSALVDPRLSELLALAGFLVAAIRLWIVHRRRRVDEHTFATG